MMMLKSQRDFHSLHKEAAGRKTHGLSSMTRLCSIRRDAVKGLFGYEKWDGRRQCGQMMGVVCSLNNTNVPSLTCTFLVLWILCVWCYLDRDCSDAVFWCSNEGIFG